MGRVLELSAQLSATALCGNWEENKKWPFLIPDTLCTLTLLCIFQIAFFVLSISHFSSLFYHFISLIFMVSLTAILLADISWHFLVSPLQSLYKVYFMTFYIVFVCICVYCDIKIKLLFLSLICYSDFTKDFRSAKWLKCHSGKLMEEN